ncbi:MAG: FAD-binding oxidoreductase [Legionellaceae bacterium]|nr:FAD-binding oxidoreductase [Legionellaceae bacterium]
MVAISSWGRLGAWDHDVQALSDRRHVAKLISGTGPGIALGMGRSYGDVCLNPNGILWQTTGLDRLMSFDETSGRLLCEAGVRLGDIQRLFIPRGWMLPVTPGTQWATVGGAIANDVHGKNHHAYGSFGDHIRQLSLVRTDGDVIVCGPQLQSEWFAATLGGLGLTGIILTAEIQLRPVLGPWLDIETQPYSNLSEFFKLADDSEAAWEHTVSWVDCLAGGRGIFMRANPRDIQDMGSNLEPKNRAITMPFVPPISLINRFSLRALNTMYFNLNKWRSGRSIAHYQSFFYPLDALLQWNRMYGPKGFYQYQCVVPRVGGKEAVQAMLQEVSRVGEGSFLTVLKTFGQRQSMGMLSFPQPGVTLALDFPNKGGKTLKLFERLDAIVQEAGGRIYLAKDARMSRDFFEEAYPRFTKFLSFRDPGMSSALSRRLMGY